MNKIYKIANIASFWECKVEINEEFIITDMCKPDEIYNARSAMEGMILFWTGGEQRLLINDGNVVYTFLEQLGREIYLNMMPGNGNHSLKSLIKEFENKEGWALMDGSWGIKIIEIDSVTVDHDDFGIEEVTNG